MGKPLRKTGTMADTLGTLNPFRYRHYVYDEETGLYYLRSKYYHPIWQRFLNADILIQAGNLFAYCENNAVTQHDPDGFEIEPLPSYYIGGIPVSANDYMAQAFFFLKYSEVYNVPLHHIGLLQVYPGMGGIEKANYSNEEKHIPSAWETVSQVASFVADITDVINNLSPNIAAAMTMYLGIPVDPAAFSTLTENIATLAEDVALGIDLKVHENRGHTHKIHRLTVTREAWWKTAHVFEFEECYNNSCIVKMYSYNLYGFQVR